MTLAAPGAGARLVAAGAALACLMMLVAGCGTAAGSSAAAPGSASASPGSGSAGGTAPDGSATSPAGVLTPSPGATLTAPPAFGVTNGFYPCPASSVKVTLGPSQVTKSLTYQVVKFTNRGSVSCSLGGYPGVSLAGGHPLAQIGLAATWPASPLVRAVFLNPGRVANFLVQISSASNYPKASCDPVRARYLVIAVPNTLGFVKLAYHATACAKPIQLLSTSPIVLGSSG